MNRCLPPKHLLLSSLLIACRLLLASPPASADSGWTLLPNSPADFGRHDDVFFVNPDLGWVVNGAGHVHRTTDGGDSWELQLESPNYLRSVGFADELNGWVGTLGQPLPMPILYRTTDGGAQWTEISNIPLPQPTGICGISVVNTSVMVACGKYDAPARVTKTTDAGASWTSMDLSLQATTLIDCYFSDENTGLIVGGIGPTFETRNALVLGTTDGGATWQPRYTGSRLGEWCWKISFATPTTGFVSIERFSGTTYFLKTTDGGQTWEDVLFQDDYEVQGIGFATPALGWIGGYGGPTYESTDGGLTWQLAGFGQLINRFRFLSENLGYAVGDYVYKYTSGATSVATQSGHSSPELILSQNHPNPFRGSTAIGYTLARSSPVRATIHDAQGRLIFTLLEANRSPGTHELTWNARDLAGHPVSAGVYWYRLETDQVAAAKKLVVR